MGRRHPDPGARPAMSYRAPINDILLALNHGAGLQAARPGRPLWRFRRRHHRRGAGGSRKIRQRRAGTAEPGRRPERHQARRRQGDHRARLARCLSALDRRRLECGVGARGVRRPGPAACDQRRLHRNLERGEHGVRALPAADTGRDRGPRRPWQQRTETNLSRKDGVGSMDRHHAADRAAGRLGCRRAAHACRAHAGRHLSHQGHQDLHHLWRPRHDRQHRAFRARAAAGCARGHQGHFAVPGPQIPGQRRRLARRAQRHLPERQSSTSSAFMPRRPAP